MFILIRNNALFLVMVLLVMCNPLVSFGVDYMNTTTYSSSRSIANDKQLNENQILTIGENVEVTMEGLLNLGTSSVLKIEKGATLIIKGNLKLYSSAKIINNGTLIVEKDITTINYCNSPQMDIYGNLFVKGNVIPKDGVSGWNISIASGVRVNIAGDLTISNSGTLNCNGRLVVGTLDEDVPDGKTIIKSNGTITNLGTININTSDEALAKTQLEPKVENSVYYAAITCGNLVNGKNQTSQDIGTINMYDGSLIVQDNAQLWYKSKILFKKGQSYIDVWGNLIQLDKTYEVKGEEALIKLNGTGAKAQINVRETYEDWTTLDNERYTHDWDLDNNQFTIDPNVQLSVGKYYTGKTEYLDEDTYSQNSWYNMQARTSITRDFYATEYSYVGNIIEDYEDQIRILNEQKDAYANPNSDIYLGLIAAMGSEDLAAEAAANRIAEINEEIANLQASIDPLNNMMLFAEDNLPADKLEELNDWFFSTDYGEWFVTQNLYIRVKKSKNSYEYKTYLNYFYYDYIYNHNNHLKLYHYILAYMDAYGNDAQYYEGRHNALSVMLPIELSYFEVSQSEDELSFEWATESESNNDYFTIEYSLDGNNFYSISTVDGAGNSSEQVRYNSSVSADCFSGVVYFRLRQTDFDGRSTYSETHAINVQGINERFEIYPNPATTVITISGEEFSSVVFVDSHSKTYPALSLGGGTYSVKNLSRGLYFAVITTAKGTAVKEFMVTK